MRTKIDVMFRSRKENTWRWVRGSNLTIKPGAQQADARREGRVDYDCDREATGERGKQTTRKLPNTQTNPSSTTVTITSSHKDHIHSIIIMRVQTHHFARHCCRCCRHSFEQNRASGGAGEKGLPVTADCFNPGLTIFSFPVLYHRKEKFI